MNKISQEKKKTIDNHTEKLILKIQLLSSGIFPREHFNFSIKNYKKIDKKSFFSF